MSIKQLKSDKALRAFSLVLAAFVALRAPGSFFALCCLGVLILILSRRIAVVNRIRYSRKVPLWWIVSFLFLVAYSFLNAIMMYRYTFFNFDNSFKELLGAAVLPPFLFVAGSFCATRIPRLILPLLISFALASALYLDVSVLHSYQALFSEGSFFPAQITELWSQRLTNVRSLEQCGFLAMLMLIWVPCNLSGIKRSLLTSTSMLILIVFALISVAINYSFNGRLGWLSLLLASFLLFCKMPSSDRTAFPHSAFLGRCINGLSAIVLLLVIAMLSRQPIWQQGLCDERFHLFQLFISNIFGSMWGGRSLEISFLDCNGAPQLLSTASDATHLMVHNVFLDTVFTSGLITGLFLLFGFTLPLLRFALRSFHCSARKLSLTDSFHWCFICFLIPQFLFQSLQYSDAVLFAFSFLWLGFLCQGFCEVEYFAESVLSDQAPTHYSD